MRRFGTLVCLGALLSGAVAAPALATTIRRQKTTCGVCGKESHHYVIGSTNTMGGPDLDLRPAEMMRSTMKHWLQQCPHCGFVSGHLSKASDGEKEVVASEPYKRVLADGSFAPLARRFLARALIEEKANRLRAVATSYIRAAWASDDASNDGAASECRRKAVTAIEALQKAGETMGPAPGTTEALLADLLRRSGRGEAAKEAAIRGLAVVKQDVIRKVLEYQRRLVESGDTARHTVKEAIAAVKDPEPTAPKTAPSEGEPKAKPEAKPESK